VTRDTIRLGRFCTLYLAEDGAYALLEHTLEPGVMGMPPHRHSREDLLSYVLEGTLTLWEEGATRACRTGEVVAKPRGRWHTFWNAGPERVRFLEVISPPAFASYYREMGAILAEPGPPNWAALGELAARYGLEMDFAIEEALAAEHGVHLG
jgi:quercetin dioxygenase-like cupin family protein